MPSVEPFDALLAELGLHNVIAAKRAADRERHYHKCPKASCKTVWGHIRAELGRTSEDFDAAHSCPQCGAEQTNKCDKEGNEI